MDVKLYVAQLLVGQLIAVIFMFLVLVRQLSLFKKRVQSDMVWFRRSLFILTLNIFIGSLVFVSINLLTIGDLVVRSTNKINLIGMIYGYAITEVVLLSSIIIWMLYRMAAKIVLINSKSNDVQ